MPKGTRYIKRDANFRRSNLWKDKQKRELQQQRKQFSKLVAQN